MTEIEWLESKNPKAMLTYVANRGRLNERKVRLFACACARLMWNKLSDDRSREALEIAERFADGLVTVEELISAFKIVQEVGDVDWSVFPSVMVGEVIHIVMAFESCWVHPEQLPPLDVQADLLRCIVGSPYKALVVEPKWITPQVISLAQAAYDERGVGKVLRQSPPDPRWGLASDGNDTPAVWYPCYHTLDSTRLAILADALEEAGCVDTEITTHLRSPGVHARGCCVIDAILGKS